MLMVFAQRMEMILRGPIGPHTVTWGFKRNKMPEYTTFNTHVTLPTNEYIVSYYKIYLTQPDFKNNIF